MNKLGQKCHIIIVGSKTNPLIEYALTTIKISGLSYTFCPDIYHAAHALVDSANLNNIIIGDFIKLKAEKGIFVNKLTDKNIPAICLTPYNYKPKSFAPNLFYLHSKKQVKTAITSLQKDENLQKANETTNSGLEIDKFKTTSEELDALLNS